MLSLCAFPVALPRSVTGRLFRCYAGLPTPYLIVIFVRPPLFLSVVRAFNHATAIMLRPVPFPFGTHITMYGRLQPYGAGTLLLSIVAFLPPPFTVTRAYVPRMIMYTIVILAYVDSIIFVRSILPAIMLRPVPPFKA